MSLPETYKVIKATETGEPEIAERPLPKPSTNQVLVKIEFTPINPTDLNKLKGYYSGGVPLTGEEAYSNGSEGSGIVVAVGDNLNLPHKVGDRVHVTGGCFAQYLLANSEQVSRVLQDDLPLEEAASHFINPATVYYMGVVAERGGHKAVIHTAGSSALGRMLIRHFKHKGIKLINVVRREEYIEELKKEGADYVLNSKSPDFEAKLKEIAHKEGATLALDAIAGTFTNKIIKAQPADSVCLVYGLLEGPEINGISIMELAQRKTLSVLFLPNYMEELSKKGEVDKFMTEVHSLLPTVLKSNVQKIFKLEDFKEALAFYHENSSKGKVLLKPN